MRKKKWDNGEEEGSGSQKRPPSGPLVSFPVRARARTLFILRDHCSRFCEQRRVGRVAGCLRPWMFPDRRGSSFRANCPPGCRFGGPCGALKCRTTHLVIGVTRTDPAITVRKNRRRAETLLMVQRLQSLNSPTMRLFRGGARTFVRLPGAHNARTVKWSCERTQPFSTSGIRAGQK